MLTSSFFSRRPPARSQRGLTLVELMVGIAIGLFVLAAGVLGTTSSLRGNRELLLEARLQQDLRAAMDLITRDVRRAGYWGNAIASIPTKTVASVANPYVAIPGMPSRPTPILNNTNPVHAAGTAIDLTSDTFTYYWDKNNDNIVQTEETYQFDVNNGVLRMQIGNDGFQAVTDNSSMRVVGLTITPRTTWLPLYDKCPSACDPTVRSCPELAVRSLRIAIGAVSSDGSVRRVLRSDVRLRNDQLSGSCS